MSGFKKATRKQQKIKLAITGPTGSGKTYSALRLATGIAKGGTIAYIDTENGSASLYSDKFEFDVLDVYAPFTPAKFVEGINEAVKGGYSVVVIDSASHFWKGILEMKDQLDQRGGNSYTNWGKVQGDYERAINSFLQTPIHVIACMRSKMAYILEENDKGKQVPKKVGMAPIMRDDVEYEFTTVFDIAPNHTAAVAKDRTGLFIDQYFQITEQTGEKIMEWLESGEKSEMMTAEQYNSITELSVILPENRKQDLSDKLSKPVTKKDADAIIDSLQKMHEKAKAKEATKSEAN